MIANVGKPFASVHVLSKKIDYHEKKIEKGVAVELCNTSGDSLHNLDKSMMLLSSISEKVNLPFIEISINLNKGEILSDDKFLGIAEDYLKRMEYENACYSIIKHMDKDHIHIHILACRVDFDGKGITNDNSWIRSQAISRQLEEEYNLQITKYNRFEYKQFKEIKAREYYYDNALRKALSNYVTKQKVNDLLEQSIFYKSIDFSIPKINEEWMSLLGKSLYEEIGEILTEKNFFKPLYKAELLSMMDQAFQKTNTVDEFRKELLKEGAYMRLVSRKGESHYVYGLKDNSIYFSDKKLPRKYRYGQMVFGKILFPDEQKHFLYQQIILGLNQAVSYDNFKDIMLNLGVQIIESSNKGGIYGISFKLEKVPDSVIFKGSDIHREFSFLKIRSFCDKEQREDLYQDQDVSSNIFKKEVVENQNIINNITSELQTVYPAIYYPIEFPTHKMRKKDDEDDNLLGKKKKKRQLKKNL